jgi:DNA-binding phage protein
MTLTRDFKATIQARAQRDPEFSQAMLEEALDHFLSGDLEIGKAMLRDYINATISFEPLAKEMRKDSKSIQRMLGVKGNPTSRSLFNMIKALQKIEGFKLHVHTE